MTFKYKAGATQVMQGKVEGLPAPHRPESFLRVVPLSFFLHVIHGSFYPRRPYAGIKTGLGE